MAPSTRDGYKRAIQAYIDHAQSLSQTKYFPTQTDTVISFICSLFSKHYAPSTITTYVSALGFINKLYGAPSPTQAFIINKLLEGCRKLNPSQDTRRPITLSMLHKLIDSLTLSQPAFFNRTLLSAMWLLAFHAFLRIGEITARSKTDTSHNNLQLMDCNIRLDNGKPQSLQITIRDSKHSKGQIFDINITANNTRYCPVQAMHNYLSHARPQSGPLFQFPGGLPVTRHYFDQQLKLALQCAGYDPKLYKGHSFRIGAASEAVALLGMSEHQVQKLGRWKSDAFKSYIRIPQFKV